MKRTTKAAALNTALLMALAATMSAQPVAESGRADEKLLPAAVRDYALNDPLILKVNRRSKDLVVEDLNGDGLADISVVSNERSILEVFHQIEKPAEGQSPFEKQTYTLDRIIRQAVAFDVNGDGRMDLLMAASPSRLVVMYQDEDGRLQPPDETELEAERLVVGDLDGDDRDDVLVYTEKRFHVLKAENRGLNLEPVQTFYTTGDPASTPMILDIDGDGLQDIVYHNAARFEDLLIRLQSPEKTFPSEFRKTTSILRNVVPLPAGKGERSSIMAVQNNTRTLVQLGLAAPGRVEAADGALTLSEIVTVPFDPDMRSNRLSIQVTDVNGDGRLDVVAISPEHSRLMVLTQGRTGSLSMDMIPTFQGIEAVIPLSPEDNAPTPMVLFSRSEKAIGFARFDSEQNTIPFPRILPVEGEPVGATVLETTDGLMLAVALRGEGAARELVGYDLGENGELSERRVLYTPAEGASNPLSGLDIVGLESIDLNRDGRADLVAYADFRPAVPFLQKEDGSFAPLNATSGVLGGLLSGATPGNLDEAAVTDPEAEVSALAIKERFARAFHIDDEGNVVVEHQFNGENSDSRLSSVSVGPLRSKDSHEVALLDRGNRVLLIFGRDNGEYRILSRLPLQDGDYSSVTVVDLDGDGLGEILLAAPDRLGIVYTRPVAGEIETIATIATMNEKDGGYGKVYTLPLAGDEALEILAVEMRDNLLEFFTTGKDESGAAALLRFYHFRMFDSETTIARRVNMDALPEPREVAGVDLDGDGRPELITLTHDNLIIYYPAGGGK